MERHLDVDREQLMNAAVLVLAGVFGSVIGSFLNVVIHRVPQNLSLVSPGSRCPGCEQPIRARHNVPVIGWLVLRGRCADCEQRISVRYPLVEAATGLLFVALTAHFGVSPELPGYLYFAAVAVALAMIDFDVYRLPDKIVLPSYGVAILLFVPVVAVTGDWWAGARALLGMTVLLAAYFAICLAYPGGMGFGDVKLAGLVGLYLGWLSWSTLAIGAFGAFLIGGIVGVALMTLHRSGRKSAIPFGPHMLGAAMLAVFVAPAIATWYSSLIGSA